MAILRTKIVLRNDLAENWILNNPLLQAGEAGVEKDTGLFKLGDGVRSWNDLPYANKPANNTFGDNQSIELDEETGILTLKNWNKQYFKWNNETQTHELTQGWISGLEPRVGADGNLAWYEPNPSTVEGLEAAIAGLQAKDELHDQEIAALRDETANYLKLGGGEMTGALILADGSAAISEAAADLKISAALNSAGIIKREIVAALPPIESADPNTIYMVKEDSTVLMGDLYTEWMVIDGEWAQIGDTSVDLTNYIQKPAYIVEDNLAIFAADGSIKDSNLSIAAISGHIEDSVIHVTAEERATWNAAALLAENNQNSIAALAVNPFAEYEVSHKPVGTLVDYKDGEIRILCPANTDWTFQNSGANADPNSYYVGVKIYAPANAKYFKESIDSSITDETFFEFENNSFAGIDQFGRKYSIIWLPVARFSDGSWAYFGTSSSKARYIGWYYTAEWYDENKNAIGSTQTRINLANEDCYYNTEPYYMGQVIKNISVEGTLLDVIDNKVDINLRALLKESDEIGINEDHSLYIKQVSFNKLYTDEDDEIILNGGSSDY